MTKETLIQSITDRIDAQMERMDALKGDDLYACIGSIRELQRWRADLEASPAW